LRTAVLVAAGFVVLRVVYRTIFGGGSGGGIQLLDLPRVPLAGPFSGISLLGPVTTGGIAAAAIGALPFAALILAIALIGVAVDLRRLLLRAASRGPLRTLSRSLVIAVSTFPALRDAVVRVRRARQLRGERSLASLLVPVLEQTVERAIALGASMEVRGFAATRRPVLDRERPVEFADAALGFDGTWIVDGVGFRLAPGTLTLVTGPTGSGKSTMLDAISGIFQHLSEGRQHGVIRVGGVDRLTTPPRETAEFVGVVAQAVRLSFVAPTVAEELGFALSTRGLDRAFVRARAAEVAAELGIEHLLDRPTSALSAGEACLVALGGALVSRPALLLLDEPLADLDAAARHRVVAVLDGLAHGSGVCVVVAEHSVLEWGAVPDRRLSVGGGAVVPASEQPRAADPAPTRHRPPARTGTPGTPAGVPLLRVAGLSASVAGRPVVEPTSFELFEGELAALVGPNGAGKSSLLLELAHPSATGTVVVDGADVASLRRRARRRTIALVPELFDDLLFATSVAEECRRADRRGVRGETATAFLRLLAGGAGPVVPSRAEGLLARHPRDLSAGERLCLVIAIQLSARPRVLLVDEPTRGLDPASRTLVGSALARLAAEGTTVLVATHDRAFVDRFAHRILEMSQGRLSESAAVMSR
jgi:energy-coupling factor transport system ATP-binding protein